MRISTIKYFIIDAIKSLRRNRTSTIASILTVAASLFLMGVFTLAILTVGRGIKSVESKIEVKIILNDDITIEQKKDIEKIINNSDKIKEVEFESKEAALEKWKKQLGESNQSLAEGLEKKNPMPNSYIIKVKTPSDVHSVVQSLDGKPGIEKIKDGRNIINKIVIITNALKWVGFILFIICIVVALFLIVNTIKLTLFARRREINIMKYVGATDWFIRWPFIIEGIVIGIIGALIATGLLYYAYTYGVYLKFSSGIAAMLFSLISPQYILYSIGWKFLLGGIIIGSLGSCFSIRKFLQV